MFTSESALVKLWVSFVEDGRYTREQIPTLSNLRDVVISLLGE